jgi:nitronate monooxygenase
MFQQMRTRLTEQLGLQVPLISAPGDGSAAVAVSAVGGLGFIDGDFDNEVDLDRSIAMTGGAQVGISLNVLALARKPALLQQVLKHSPKAIMMSPNGITPFAAAIKAAGIPLICQCETLCHVKQALQAGATLIVAKPPGTACRRASLGTMSFLAEVAGHLKRESPDTLLLAAGGILDGRGVAAALMLGADGAFIDSGFSANGNRELLIAAERSNWGPPVQATKHTVSPFNISTLHTATNRHGSMRAFTGAPKHDPAYPVLDTPCAKSMVTKVVLEASQVLSMSGVLARSSL